MTAGQGFNDLAKDLGAMPAHLTRGIGPIVRRTALEIKKGMQADARASRHFKALARSIDYDISNGDFFGSSNISAEIGPNHSRHDAAGLAGIAYFGGANGGGGTVRDPAHHLQQQAALMEKHIGDLLEEDT